MSKESVKTDYQQYVGPYRLEKTLGKGQTGKNHEGFHDLLPLSFFFTFFRTKLLFSS